ncbi:hypothetical protein [Kitasatospora brasiliensis]|uniref:hypothetical protein n=1 Tax=Kitasatospora brasiliensis TaxID=3058040 RepID=UPI00292D76E5|nr:hypothetical protein [Kitasatospora sp. K002]
MVGVELAVGFLFAWAVRKAKRVAGRADAEVDRALDAGMDRLHDVVTQRLGTDHALARLVEEAEDGRTEPTERTRQRLLLALEDEVERDTGFAETLLEAVTRVQAAETAASPAPGANTLTGITFNGPTAVLQGDGGHQENHF